MMKKITKEELRDIQLAMVAHVDRVCRAEGIEYSLSAGSLLGAVKYGGYIPWDDDVDIMLRRTDYERLMAALMAALPAPFDLLYYKSRPTYLPMAKLYDRRTVFESTLDTLNKGTGVFIDIFPVDSLPADEAECEAFKREVRHAVTQLTASHRGLGYASSEHVIYFLAKSVLWLPAHLRTRGQTLAMASRVDALMQRYNATDAPYANYVFSPPKHIESFDKLTFTAYEDVAFEGLTLRKIRDHDDFLTELYGNWRKPPKHGQQRTHSYYHWYWKDT